MAELREVAAILDAGKIDEEALQSALQALLFHQCLYEDWPHVQAYRIIARHLSNVQPIMGAFGYLSAARLRSHARAARLASRAFEAASLSVFLSAVLRVGWSFARSVSP